MFIQRKYLPKKKSDCLKIIALILWTFIVIYFKNCSENYPLHCSDHLLFIMQNHIFIIFLNTQINYLQAL